MAGGDETAAPVWLREVPAVRVMRQAWTEQYHRDTDVRYGVKRGSGWCGYKVHLSETCEPDAPHPITNVETADATVNDTELTAKVHQHLAERELQPREHVVDAGYVTAARRRARTPATAIHAHRGPTTS
ncbi:hypothetical protein [Streptomyces sp. NPDC055287]